MALDAPSFIFGGNTGVTLEELQRRRAIMEARAKQRLGYPTTAGQGLFSLGESIGDVLADRSMTAQERAYDARRRQDLDTQGPGARVAPAAPPPVASSTSYAAPPPTPKVSAYAPDEPRESITTALLNQATGRPPGEVGDENPTIGAATTAPGSDNAARQNAIAGIESGGRYNALGPVTRSGDRAYGKYQVMGSNIGPWTEEALGQRLTPQQFLASKEAQDAVFNRRMGQYVNQFGEEGAARAWFGGPGNVNNPNVRDQLGTSVGGYGRNYLAALGGDRGGGRLALASTGTLSDAPSILPRVPGGADEAPEPTPTDIQPAPIQVAQAGGGVMRAPAAASPTPQSPLGRLPGAFDPRVQEPPAPASGLPSVDPAARKPLVEPRQPQRQDTPSEEELRALRLMRAYPGDPLVQQQAAALAAFGKEKREAAYQREVEKYKLEFGAYEKEVAAEKAYQRERPGKEFELSEKRAAAERADRDRADFPLGIDKHAAIIKDSYETVKNIPKAQAAIEQVRGLLNSDKGMFTGSPANIKLSLAKWAQAVGAPYDPRVDNTETFRGLIVPILAQLRPTIVGPGAQSQPELKMLQDAAAGNVTLERGSIMRILNAVEKQGVLDAVNHQRIVIANSGGRENARQVFSNSYPLPMDRLVPRGIVERLRTEVARNPDKAAQEMEDFDREYYTPGLARKVLGR